MVTKLSRLKIITRNFFTMDSNHNGNGGATSCGRSRSTCSNSFYQRKFTSHNRDCMFNAAAIRIDQPFRLNKISHRLQFAQLLIISRTDHAFTARVGSLLWICSRGANVDLKHTLSDNFQPPRRKPNDENENASSTKRSSWINQMRVCLTYIYVKSRD